MFRKAKLSALVNVAQSLTLVRNQRGSVLLMVAFTITALFAFAALAIDGAIMMTARTQLHNAADAAALAGASGLLQGGPDVAIDRAIRFASLNNAVEKKLSTVKITADDISFPAPNIIRVRTHRTEATDDALRTYFLRIVRPINGNRTDVSATSAAQVYDICGARCLKPWMIPDRWDDANNNDIYDDGEYYDKDATGYTAALDAGTQVVLKVSDPHETIESGVFFPVTYPPLDTGQGNPETGAKDYYNWIVGCTPYLVNSGDRVVIEPGNMVGPTRHGLEELTAQDPNAYWNDYSECVSGSAYARSPRIALVPFFDPRFPPTSGRNWITVTKIGAFFIEQLHPNGDVTGRFIKVTAQGSPCSNKALGNSMVKGIALVE
ncbi:MAG: pilus assembly protein TadG-related protein [Candidatus Latescibacterota bacterium]